MPVKFDDSSSNGSGDIQQRRCRMQHFRPFLNFDNCHPEVVGDIISGMVDQDVGMDVCANFADSGLRLPEASIFGDDDRRHSMFGLKIQLLVAWSYSLACSSLLPTC